MLLVSKNVNFVISNPSVEYEESTQFISADILDELSSSNFDEPSALENSSSENEILQIVQMNFFNVKRRRKQRKCRDMLGALFVEN